MAQDLTPREKHMDPDLIQREESGRLRLKQKDMRVLPTNLQIFTRVIMKRATHQQIEKLQILLSILTVPGILNTYSKILTITQKRKS